MGRVFDIHASTVLLWPGDAGPGDIMQNTEKMQSLLNDNKKRR